MSAVCHFQGHFQRALTSQQPLYRLISWLSIADKEDTFVMPESELAIIKSFVEKTFNKTKAVRQRPRRQAQDDFDGQFSVEVISEVSTDGRRVSMRKRKEKTFSVMI